MTAGLKERLFALAAIAVLALAGAPPVAADGPDQCIRIAEASCPSGYPVDCGEWCCQSGYSCCGSSIQCCRNCIGWPGSTPRYLCCGSNQFGCVDSSDNIWCCDNGKACGAYGQCE